ncbi:MAG: leucine-rich repeat protein, partial [Phocaeicola sp.]
GIIQVEVQMIAPDYKQTVSTQLTIIIQKAIPDASVEKIFLEPSEMQITMGGGYGVLKVAYEPYNAVLSDLEWESSDRSVVLPLGEGVIIGLKESTEPVVVTAKTKNGSAQGSCLVTVGSKVFPVTGIELKKKELSIGVGDVFTRIRYDISPPNATNQKVIWLHEDESIAKVDAQGVITGVGYGSAKITAMTEDGGYKSSVQVTVEDALEYELVADTFYRVKGRGSIKGSDITIPDTYMYLPVTEIGDGAFTTGDTNITSVTIGKNVKIIGNSAFKAGSSSTGTLTTLTFESGSTESLSIGNEAFKDQKIQKLDIPSRMTSIGERAFQASSDNGVLENLTFEAGGTQDLTIGNTAFGNHKLVAVEIPKRTTSIGSNAFEAVSGSGTLEELTFEAGGSEDLRIGERAFDYQQIRDLEIP